MGYYHRGRLYAGVDKYANGMWSFGFSIYHLAEETYLSICFYKWSIYIGRVHEYEVRR